MIFPSRLLVGEAGLKDQGCRRGIPRQSHPYCVLAILCAAKAGVKTPEGIIGTDARRVRIHAAV
jgi:hypothetical protein